MSHRRGALVVSLDFELYWGLRDVVRLESYRANLLGVRQAVPAMLTLFERYSVHATWATVGFLFAKDRDELHAYLPSRRPEYADRSLSPYAHVERIGRDERDDPFHFAPTLVQRITDTPGQEIGTHTFSHFYCLEAGQDESAFDADLEAAARIAAARGLVPRSLVLPRNQWNPAYEGVLDRRGITAYRINRRHPLHRAQRKSAASLARRGLRLLDSYVPLSGDLAVPLPTRRTAPVELHASAFLRPYSPRLRHLDVLKRRRLEDAMRRAALRGEVFHLWWHPHNFGTHLEANLAFLERLLVTYRALADSHGMRSLTMGELADHTVSESQ